MGKAETRHNQLPKAVMIAGLAGGSGKSVVSVGLTAAFSAQGKKVVPFKKGPDYIDAGWLKLAAGNQCYNLDQYLMEEESVHTSFGRRVVGSDIVLVEGNRGLYDGVNADGGFSTADLAVSLNIPVILVVNCTKTTRTIAALVLGCMKLDERVDIRGVVLNHVATPRQKRIITEAVEKYTGLPVLGVIPRLKRDIFPMRHLGMIPYQEYHGCRKALSFLTEIVTKNVDLAAVESTMASVATDFKSGIEIRPCEKKVVIGVLQDAAFQFYYSENLEALESVGADLIKINALTEKLLPEIDGLYIGGGFPETSARELSANVEFRKSINNAAERGLPIYAECGGLIYLGESIVINDVEYDLAGVFPVRFGMAKKPQAHGYTIFEVIKNNPFYLPGTVVKGHEFRYSTILDFTGKIDDLTVKMKRGVGFLEGYDGLCTKNTLAMYTHIHAEGTPEWAPAFIKRCLDGKNMMKNPTSINNRMK